MTDEQKRDVVDMRWLAEGREDQFKGYLSRAREELPLADWSDDELANLCFMHGDISKEEDVIQMIEAHKAGKHHISKIAILTAVKERMRWLTRRLAVAEGRYPGVPSPGVQPMPELSMLGDDGKVLTVNPDWCDWYESTYGDDTGSGYIKGREIMMQIENNRVELVENADAFVTEAMKSAVHKMRETDPSRGLPEFKTIAQAEESVNGQRERYFDQTDGSYYVEGYLNVKDLEGLLFAARVREMAATANLEVPNIELVQVNQLHQVLHPRLEVRDIDSNIFAQPVKEGYTDNLSGVVDGLTDPENRSASKALLRSSLLDKTEPGDGVRGNALARETLRMRELRDLKLTTVADWTREFGLVLVYNVGGSTPLEPSDVVPEGFDLRFPDVEEMYYHVSTAFNEKTRNVYHRVLNNSGGGFVLVCSHQGQLLGAEPFSKGSEDVVTLELIVPLQWKNEDIHPALRPQVLNNTRNSKWEPAYVVGSVEENVEESMGEMRNVGIMFVPTLGWTGRAMVMRVHVPQSIPHGSFEHAAKRSTLRDTAMRDFLVQGTHLTDEQVMANGRLQRDRSQGENEVASEQGVGGSKLAALFNTPTMRSDNPALEKPVRLTDAHGGRGVSVEVWPDDKIPAGDWGTDAQTIIGQDSIDKRIAVPAMVKLNGDYPELNPAWVTWLTTLHGTDELHAKSIAVAAFKGAVSMVKERFNANQDFSDNEREMLDTMGFVGEGRYAYLIETLEAIIEDIQINSGL